MGEPFTLNEAPDHSTESAEALESCGIEEEIKDHIVWLNEIAQDQSLSPREQRAVKWALAEIERLERDITSWRQESNVWQSQCLRAERDCADWQQMYHNSVAREQVLERRLREVEKCLQS